MSRLAIVVVSALVVLASAEAGARVLEDRLPEPRQWHSVEAEQKVDQMDALAGTGVDVALVGTSVVNGGIDPIRLGEALGRDAYNAALSAGTPLLMEAWTTSVVLPRLRPEVLVYGLISFDFYGHPSQEAFRDAFAASPGGARALGAESVMQRLNRAIGGLSSLWENRTALREPSALLDAAVGQIERPPAEFGPVGPAGRVQYGEEPPIAAGIDDADQEAGLPVQDWRLDREPMEAVRSMIAAARESGSTVVLVAMPVSQDYVDRLPGGEADQQEFLAALEGLAADEGVVLVDLEDRRDPDLYLDEVHLDDDGAASVTDALADHLAGLRVLS